MDWLPQVPDWLQVVGTVAAGTVGGYALHRTVQLSYTWTFGEKKEKRSEDE